MVARRAAAFRASCAALLLAGLMIPAHASAQVSTGTVTGTVKDGQGGVIPGATVTLTNERQGTALAPAVTSNTGDYVFPNVPTGTYTVEVTMIGVRELEADRRGGERGRPRVAAAVHARRRRRDRNDQGHRRSAAHPVAERRALVHHHRRRGREPADPEPHVQRARVSWRPA